MKNDQHLDFGSNFTEKCQSKIICNETLTGLSASSSNNGSNFVLDANCVNTVENFFTIVLIQGPFIQQIIENIRVKYPKVKIILGQTTSSSSPPSLKLEKNSFDKNVKLVKLSSREEKSQDWVKLIRYVETEYVFVGYRLLKLQQHFGNFERMVRLLNATYSTGMYKYIGVIEFLKNFWIS